MDQEIKGIFSELGLTIRDFFQYTLPGTIMFFSALLLIIDLPQITFSELMSFLSEIGFYFLIFFFLLSYVIGQFIACTTHVIDRLSLFILKKRIFGIPVKLKNNKRDFRTELFEIAYDIAIEALRKDKIPFSEAAYESVMEYMLYFVMIKNNRLFLDIQRYQAIVFFRKHMTIALLPYIYLFVICKKFNLVIIVVFLIITFFVGYRRLYIRTFFERIPLSYLQVVLNTKTQRE